jgi:molecular chaperone GrpE
MALNWKNLGRKPKQKKSMSDTTNDTPLNQNETEQQKDLPEMPTDEKEKRIAELEEQVAALNDKHLRLYSEFDNFRKRTSKEKVEILTMANAEVIKSLLPVVDDLERAQKNNETSKDIDAITEGFNLIAQKFRNILMQKGLEPMNSIGQTFDADLYEAVTNIPAPSEDMKGKVVDELEKGYMLNGKIIRFAKVIVGN